MMMGSRSRSLGMGKRMKRENMEMSYLPMRECDGNGKSFFMEFFFAIMESTFIIDSFL